MKTTARFVVLVRLLVEHGGMEKIVGRKARGSLGVVRTFLLINIFLLAGVVQTFAQGSPPFYTDDTATAEKNQWVLDVSFSTERARNGDSISTAPSIGISYGLTNRVEIDYSVPLLIARFDGESMRSGFGDSVVGVKWRFLENNSAKFSMSVDPQIEFDNPTASRRHGLVENNTEFLLPFQIQKSFGDIDTAVNFGRTFHAREPGDHDNWLAGIAAGRKIAEHMHVGMELYGEAARKFDRGRVIFNVGAVFEISDKLSVSASLGRGVAGADRPDVVGFVGMELLH